jgi:hypothetical protein
MKQYLGADIGTATSTSKARLRKVATQHPEDDTSTRDEPYLQSVLEKDPSV